MLNGATELRESKGEMAYHRKVVGVSSQCAYARHCSCQHREEPLCYGDKGR